MPGRPRVPRLLAIVPPDSSAEEIGALLPELRASVDAVLLRWPRRDDRWIFEAARTLARIPERPLLLVSDRLDIACSVGLDGVQLKDGGIPPSRIPDRLRPALLGASRHTEQGLIASVGADYVTLSPYRETSSKPGQAGLGLERLLELAASSPVPVLALGGVRVEDLRGLLQAGIHGAAVSSGIFAQPDPAGAADAYAKALREARRA